MRDDIGLTFSSCQVVMLGSCARVESMKLLVVDERNSHHATAMAACTCVNSVIDDYV